MSDESRLYKPPSAIKPDVAVIGGQKCQYYAMQPNEGAIPMPTVNGQPDGQPDGNTMVVLTYNQLSAVIRELISLRERIAKLESAPPPLFEDIGITQVE